MNTTHYSRRSGRTQRMLTEAIDQARHGKRVRVLCANEAEVNRITALAKKLAIDAGCEWVVGGEKSNIVVLSTSNPYVKEAPAGVFYIRGFGHDTGEITMVDHYVYEHKYPHIVDGWLRAQY